MEVKPGRQAEAVEVSGQTLARTDGRSDGRWRRDDGHKSSVVVGPHSPFLLGLPPAQFFSLGRREKPVDGSHISC